MPVNRGSGGKDLDRDEMNALRGISKGLLIQTISPEHRNRLTMLGYIRDVTGTATITLSGKAMLGK